MTSPAEHRRAQALELHLAGASYAQICERVGYKSKASAHEAVQKALAAAAATTERSEMVASQLARIDAMLTGLWPKARRGDVAAVDRVIRLEQERRVITAIAKPSSDDEVPKELTPLDEIAARRAARAGQAPDQGRAVRRNI